jgi:DNA-binding winged helix-turn-helix (wHTH) protein
MREVGPEHPLNFRSEAVSWIMERIQERESCILVSAPQMGMTRLIDFVSRLDVQQYYLADLSLSTLLLRVDSNRLEQPNRWGLCELLLTVIKEGCHAHPHATDFFDELSQLHKEVIYTNNDLLAHRNLEMAISILVLEHNIDLYFLVNEFDELYANLENLELSNLRAIRDAYKYRVNYGLCLRDFPDRIRKDSRDRLTTLASRNIFSLGPYSKTDAESMILQLEIRKNKKLPTKMHKWIIDTSGGNPGLLSAIFDTLEANQLSIPLSVEDLLKEDSILRACQTLWDGLAKDEQKGLEQCAQNYPSSPHIRNLLKKKHLIQWTGEHLSTFSPLFTAYTLQSLRNVPNRLIVMPGTFQVRIGSAPPIDLSQREYRLMATLYAHRDQVVTKDRIRDDVYDGEDVSDEAIANLVRQVRNKIEPVKSSPYYIRTAHGKGYTLFSESDDNNTIDQGEDAPK